MGDEVWAWFRVHPEVAKVTRACVYDRAGYGFSDPPRRSGTAAHAVADLHALLGAARIAAPIVLVGQSYGGRIAQLYAYTHAKDISGLVLVDADHEDSAARGNKVTQGKLKLLDQQMDAAFEQCRAAAKAGLKEGTEAWAACVGDESAAYGPALWPAVKASRQRLSRWDALASERKNYDTRTAAELRAARRPFGDLPLIYLTRGVSPFAEPGKPQSALNKAFEDDVFKSHEDIARLSTRGENRVVAGAGHNIHMDNPQAVIDAVRAVIDMHSR
jgi:pimeloyl-ACP methyl ester carboxylesterase